MENNRFTYGDGLAIEIPEQTDHCVVRARHAYSVQEGDDRTRTLTRKGQRLCDLVWEPYRQLIGFLENFFGPAAYVASEFPRSLITAYQVTNAAHITSDRRLNVTVRVKDAPAPPDSEHANLRDHLKAQGRSEGEITATLAENPSLFGNNAGKEMLYHNQRFIEEPPCKSKLTVSFDHEPNISMLAAKNGVPPELLGLKECQAFVFFIGEYWKILSIQKFMPLVTFRVGL